MRVAVVQGGPSSEAEVSRASARCVREALEAEHTLLCMELDPTLPAALVSFAPDVVFPAVHGTQGEDGCLQGLLEILRLPYIGSDVRGSALAADKVASKVFFRKAGLAVAAESVLTLDNPFLKTPNRLSSLRRELGARLIVKPAHGGSTLGMSRIVESDGEDALEEALSIASGHDPQVLVEELISGKEFTCSVVGEGADLRALPVTYIEAKAADWLDFESKYAKGGSLHQCPALIDKKLSVEIQEASVVAHRALGLRDLSRADFIVNEEGRAIILETNTLPGMTAVSLLPEAVAADGGDFGQFLDALVRGAKKRGCGAFNLAEALPGG